MQRTAEGFWVFCSTYTAPESHSRHKWKKTVSLGFVPDNKHAGSLPKATSSPTPTGHPAVYSLLTLNLQRWPRSHSMTASYLRSAHTSSVDHEPWLGSLTPVTNWQLIQIFFDPNPMFKKSSQPLTELGNPYIWSPLIIKYKTPRQQKGGEA